MPNNPSQGMDLHQIASRVAGMARKLTLKSQKGRRQVWDLDGITVTSLSGDGHVETHSVDTAAADLVSAFIRGAIPSVSHLYPKVGETIEVPM